MDDAVINEKFQRVWDRFDALEKEMSKADAVTLEATAKAERVMDSYKATANEFRGSLADQASSFLTRQEYNAYHSPMIDRLSVMESRQLQNTASLAGRETGITTVGYIVMAIIMGVGALVSTASLVINIFRSHG